MLTHNSPRGVILGSAFCSVIKVHRPPHFSHVLGNYARNVWPSGFGRTNCSDRNPCFGMARDNHLTGNPARYKPPTWENPNFAIFKVRLLPGDGCRSGVSRSPWSVYSIAHPFIFATSAQTTKTIVRKNRMESRLYINRYKFRIRGLPNPTF